MFPFLPSHPRCCPTRFGLRGVDGKGNERLFVFSAVLRLSFSLTFASCVPRDAQEYTPVVPDTYVSFDILLRLRETDINPFKATVWNTLRWEVKGRCLWSRVSWSPPASIHLFPFGMMKSSLLKFPRLTLTSLSDPSFFFFLRLILVYVYLWDSVRCILQPGISRHIESGSFHSGDEKRQAKRRKICPPFTFHFKLSSLGWFVLLWLLTWLWCVYT
jgi:hypothetical protein